MDATLDGPGLFILRCPLPPSSDGEYETSQVPGEPLRTCHALRPRRTAHPLPIRGARCCLPLRKRRRLRNHFLSRLNHAACTLPVYASTVASRPHDATLGSGWWLAFPGTGLSPAGFQQKVSDMSSYMASPFSKLCLAQFPRKHLDGSPATRRSWR